MHITFGEYPCNEPYNHVKELSFPNVFVFHDIIRNTETLVNLIEEGASVGIRELILYWGNFCFDLPLCVITGLPFFIGLLCTMNVRSFWNFC